MHTPRDAPSESISAPVVGGARWPMHGWCRHSPNAPQTGVFLSPQDFIWLCLIHGVTTGTAAPAAQFFVTGGAGTDGPKKSVVFNGADYNWDNAGLLATTDYFQLKTNVWVYGPSLGVPRRGRSHLERPIL